MADQQTGVIEPAAGAQQKPQVSQKPIIDSQRGSYDPNAIPPDPMNEHQGPIPYERFTAVNNRLKVMEQQIQERDRQLQLYQAQLAQGNQTGATQPQQPQAPQAPAPNPLLDMLEGIDDDDVVEGKTIKQVVARVMQQQDNLMQQQAATSAITQFIATHPDYGQLVGSPQQLAEPIQNVLNSNQQIAQDIAQSPNPMQTAYNYAKMYMTLQQQFQPKNPQGGQEGGIPFTPPVFPGQHVHPSAITAFNAAHVPASPANAGSGAGFNKAHRYGNMSEQEFATHRANVIANQR